MSFGLELAISLGAFKANFPLRFHTVCGNRANMSYEKESLAEKRTLSADADS